MIFNMVLNYSTEGKVLCGASRELPVKRHLGFIKTKQFKKSRQSKTVTNI